MRCARDGTCGSRLHVNRHAGLQGWAVRSYVPLDKIDLSAVSGLSILIICVT